MQTLMNIPTSKVLRLPCLVSLLFLCIACAQQSNLAPPPIKIGVSVSTTGAFANTGETIQRGYQLWADTVNAHGGLLGRQVQLVILPDDSSSEVVANNYLQLITADHVDLLFGPTATPLTVPAAVVAQRYGYALLEGSGGGVSVFDRGLDNVFDVSLSDADGLASFTQYIFSLPTQIRPKTASYLFVDNPTTMGTVNPAHLILVHSGIKSAFYFIYPQETSAYADLAREVAQSGAQIVVLGTQFTASVAFIQTLEQQNYNPEVLIATNGPEQRLNFIKALGSLAAEGLLVPRTWYPEATTYQNAAMVKAYLASYKGVASDIDPDTTAAYSVGQVLEQAVNTIHRFDNAALITELHTGIFHTVQGTAQFDNSGQNIAAQAYLLQWQKGALKCVYPPSAAVAPPEFPKPQWP